MPFIKFLVFKYYALLTISISLNSEIISPYSYCVKKGLIYITITAPFNHQPVSCLKYTKVNTYSSYHVCLVSINK